jgi:tetratricopeptide (TPR) repeat protein
MDCHQPHDGGTKDCATCHMPKRGVRDVVHTSYTDHRIQRPNSAIPAGDPTLRPWRVHPLDGERSSALAQFEWGIATRNAASIQTAFAKLIDLPAGQKNDPEVLTALAAVALQKQRPREAVEWLRQAAKLEPRNAEARMRLARAEQANNRLDAALEQYEAAIQIDPLLLEPYVLMARLHRSRGNLQGFEATLRRYLKHVPQSLTVRQALADWKAAN